MKFNTIVLALFLSGCGPNAYVQVVKGEIGPTGEIGMTGSNGAMGPTGPQGEHSITKVIDPCGKVGSYDEVLLAFANGNLVALFVTSNHQYPRFSLIPDGNYLTSDNTSCYFSVSTSGSTRTVTWTGGSESWNIQ